MATSDIPIEALSSEHIRDLIASGTSEGKTLEFKRDLPGTSDGHRKEFLADVSSFANASGGLILFGIEEQEGVASGAVGFPDEKLDVEILRLENMARTGIEERIPGLRIRAVPVADDRSVVALKVPRSWAGPHMVSFKSSSRFFARDSRGKYQLDLRELRRAFDRAAAVRDRVREFRVERVASIIAGETPVPLFDGPKVVLHVIPTSSVGGAQLDIATVDTQEVGLTPLRSQRSDVVQYNFEGLAVSTPTSDEGIAPSYAQLFRSGTIEAVHSTLIYEEDGQRFVRSLVVEAALIDGVEQYLRVARELGVEAPYALAISFTGVEGYQVLPETRNRHWSNFRNPLDRDILLIPEVISDSGEPDVPSLLRPVFDTLWQSAGWPHCHNYDQDGKHRPTEEYRKPGRTL